MGSKLREKMEEPTYRIVFHGKIAPGEEMAIVKERLSEIFKLEGPRIEQLFRSTPRVVKRNLSIELALKYKQRFEESGALCDIEKEGDVELSMETRNSPELPAKAHVNTMASSPESARTKTPSSFHVNDFTEEAPAAIPENTPSKVAPVDDDEFEDGFFSLPNLLGYLIGGLVGVLVYAISDAFGLKGTLFGFELKLIAGTFSSLLAWNRSRDWLRKLRRRKKTHYLVIKTVTMLGVATMIVFYGYHFSFKKSEKMEKQEVKSITQTRLDNLQTALNAIQGAAMGMVVPFPDTPEQILEITRTYKSLFPGNIWMMGPKIFEDEWGVTMHYEHHGNMSYTIISAGPDKVFDTEDDLIVTNMESPDSAPQDAADPLDQS